MLLCLYEPSDSRKLWKPGQKVSLTFTNVDIAHQVTMADVYISFDFCSRKERTEHYV